MNGEIPDIAAFGWFGLGLLWPLIGWMFWRSWKDWKKVLAGIKEENSAAKTAELGD